MIGMRQNDDTRPGLWNASVFCGGCGVTLSVTWFVIWYIGDPDPPNQRAFIVVCSEQCAETVHGKYPELLEWETKPMALFIAELTVSTQSVAAVTDHLDRLAQGMHALAVRMPTAEPKTDRGGTPHASEDH